MKNTYEFSISDYDSKTGIGHFTPYIKAETLVEAKTEMKALLATMSHASVLPHHGAVFNKNGKIVYFKKG